MNQRIWTLIIIVVALIGYIVGYQQGRDDQTIIAARPVQHQNESPVIKTVQAAPAALSAQINPNIANLQELDTLPGIGKTLAQRIVDDRNENGPYQSAKDLARVSGIGPKLVKKLHPHLTFKETAQ